MAQPEMADHAGAMGSVPLFRGVCLFGAIGVKPSLISFIKQNKGQCRSGKIIVPRSRGVLRALGSSSPCGGKLFPMR